jgi:LysR family transcriptional regulator, transcription activator of glutamate synthase operon
MELRQLRTFAAVARHANFTRAGEELHLAQSAVSQQVHALERELGQALLERTSRRVRLTQAGELLLTRAHRILAEVDAAQEEIAGLAELRTGRVTLGSTPLGSLDTPELVATFHHRHPEIEVRLREGTASEILDGLRAGEVDLAFAFIDAAAPGEGLVAEHLLDEELVLAITPGHRFAARTAVTLAEVATEPLITFKPGSTLRDSIAASFAAAGVTPRVPFDSNEPGSARAMVSHGLGVAFLPRSFAALPGPPVDVVALDPPLMRSVSAVWRAGVRLTAAAEAFRSFAVAQTG